MILKMDDWVFDIDLDTTIAYSAKEARDHCECAYCRNFYATVDAVYPNLRPFLAQFGVDIEAPEEMYQIDQLRSQAFYGAKGKLLQRGQPFYIDGVAIDFDRGACGCVRCQPPFVEISVGLMELPWVLDEPFEDVVSPANEPGFLKKIWSWLLGRAEGTLKS